MVKSKTHQERAPGSGQPLSSLPMRARKVPAARWDHPFALHNCPAGWTAPHALESFWKSPAWKSFAVWCVLGALLWNVKFGLAQNRPGRPEHQTNSIVSAPQVRVNPHTIALPIVDEKGIRFTRLSTDEGLSQAKVFQIIQDDQGFMWFGTQYGLNRYDGYTFKVFAHDAARANSLSGVYIFSVFKDRSGYLWVGSDESLDRFDPRTEVFTHYKLQQPGSDQGDATVGHIAEDEEGAIWLATVT